MANTPMTAIAMREVVTCLAGLIFSPSELGRSRDMMLPASDRNRLEVESAAASTAG